MPWLGWRRWDGAVRNQPVEGWAAWFGVCPANREESLQVCGRVGRTVRAVFKEEGRGGSARAEDWVGCVEWKQGVRPSGQPRGPAASRQPVPS